MRCLLIERNEMNECMNECMKCTNEIKTITETVWWSPDNSFVKLFLEGGHPVHSPYYCQYLTI